MVEVREPRQVQEDERELERIPAPVRRHVHALEAHLFPATDTLGVQRVDALLPHGTVEESEGSGGLRVGAQQCQAGLDPPKRLAAAGHRLPRDVLVPGEPGRRVSSALGLAVDPLAIRRDETPELPREFLISGLGQLLHIRDDVGESWYVDRRRGGHAQDVGGGNDARRDPVRSIGTERGLRVHADAVSDRELDVMAIDHRHRPVLGVHMRIVAAPSSADEDRRLVRSGHGDLGLEEPEPVAIWLLLLLAIDEKQRDDPVVALAAHQPLDCHVRKFGAGAPPPGAFLERGDESGFDLAALPDALRVAGLRLDRVALALVVAAPAGGDGERAGDAVDAEGESERRREHRPRLGRSDVDAALLRRPVAADGKIVELLGLDHLAARREQANEVAVGDGGFVDLLGVAASRAQEILDDRRLQRIADLGGGEGLKDRVRHPGRGF